MISAGFTRFAKVVRQALFPTRMQRVGLFFLSDDAPQVVSALARLEACHVDRIPSELEDFLKPCFPPEFRAAYQRLRQSYEPLAQRWAGALPGEDSATQLVRSRSRLPESPLPRVPTIDEMLDTATQLEVLLARIDDIAQQSRRLQQRQLELEHFDEYVRVLAELEIDVNGLTELRFLHVRAGTVPQENFVRLRESAELGNVIVLGLGEHGDRAHVLIVGVGGISADLEGLLAKAQFEAHPRPAFSESAGSQGIVQRLRIESEELAAAAAQLAADEVALRETHRDLLRCAAIHVARAAVFAECDGILEGHGPLSFLGGWVVAERVEELRRNLARDIANPVCVVVQPPVAHETEERAPSEVVVPRLLRPGLDLVSMYGTTDYSELNPTLVVAATTPLLFGMMFGDVGHGLMLVLAALLLRRWLRRWVVAGISCGIAAILFGMLYGSVFGMEHWMPALWLRPMEEPFRILEMALWMGVGYVLLSSLLKTANLFHQRQWLAAWIGLQGLAGAAFYLGGVLTIRALYVGEAFPQMATSACLAGLLLAALHTVLELRRHGRAAGMELASEVFHTLLSLFTNTLSFLRLAAFALAHAALSLATFLVMDALPASTLGWLGRSVVFLCGTAVILVLDGLAVGIQTIRLQFYEGLARYYRGEGRVFRPLRFEI